MVAPCLRILLFLAAGHAAAAAGDEPQRGCGDGECTAGMNLFQHQQVQFKDVLAHEESEGGPAVHINNDWLIVHNKRYSRSKAHDAWLGRIGRTNGIWVRPVQINFRSVAPEEWFVDNVNVTTTLTLTSSQARQITASIGGGMPTAGGPVSGGAGISHNSSHNASYVLQGITFGDTLRIKHWFNDDANSVFAQDYKDMYDAAHKPRIVTTVWVVVSGGPEHASSCTGGHLTLRYGTNATGHITASIAGQGCVHSTWSFDANTIVAYEASYLQFENMAANPPRGRVKDVPVDWYWTR